MSKLLPLMLCFFATTVVAQKPKPIKADTISLNQFKLRINKADSLIKVIDVKHKYSQDQYLTRLKLLKSKIDGLKQ